MWEFAQAENKELDRANEEARLYQIEQQRIRDKEIAYAAAESARKEAAAEIEASRLAELKAKQDVIDQGIENERLKQLAIIDSAHGEALLELRDINERAAEEQRKLDKIESDKLAEANERANVARALAEQIAKQELADKKIADDLADKKANAENRHKVHTAMKEYLVSMGVDGDVATKVVKGMGSDEMPHVVVNY